MVGKEHLVCKDAFNNCICIVSHSEIIFNVSNNKDGNKSLMGKFLVSFISGNGV